MGIFDWMKGVTFIEVIEWTDDSPNTLVYRFPTYDKMVKWGAQLTVRESQTAIFVNEGRLADVFQPGRYTLSTKNLPILVGLMGIPFGAQTPFKSDIFFVNMREFTNQKWGTPNPIIMRSAEHGAVRIRGFGTYTFRVADPVKVMKTVSGTAGRFTADGIVEQLRSFIVQKFADFLGESKVSVLDLAAQYNEISEGVRAKIAPDFLEFGLNLSRIVIENITLPEELEKALDTRGKMNILGNLDDYTKLKAADALSDAAKNPGGAAGAGVGLGAGVVMGQQMMGAMSQPQAAKPAAPAAATLICPACNQQTNPGKFCGHCGQAMSPKCPGCKGDVAAGARFCNSCGTKLT